MAAFVGVDGVQHFAAARVDHDFRLSRRGARAAHSPRNHRQRHRASADKTLHADHLTRPLVCNLNRR